MKTKLENLNTGSLDEYNIKNVINSLKKKNKKNIKGGNQYIFYIKGKKSRKALISYFSELGVKLNPIL